MSDTPAPARYANGRFGPGNPGRRAGVRNKVSHRAAMAILEDFELHKDDVLKRLRIYHTPDYFAILNRLLDRELKTETPMLDDLDEAELARIVAVARSTLNLDQSPRTALLALDGVLVGHAGVDSAVPADRVYGD